MRVEIWSDVVCPWCYIGKRHFEQALESFEHRDEVEVTWRSFELDPGHPRSYEGDLSQALADKYGTSLEQARAMVDAPPESGCATTSIARSPPTRSTPTG